MAETQEATTNKRCVRMLVVAGEAIDGGTQKSQVLSDREGLVLEAVCEFQDASSGGELKEAVFFNFTAIRHLNSFSLLQRKCGVFPGKSG